MHKTIAAYLIAVIFPLLSVAQITTLTGKVIDSNTKQAIAFATFTVGNTQYLTNNRGDFLISFASNELTRYGISISCAGYLPLRLDSFNTDKFLLIELTKSNSNLEDVMVTTSARMIVERSIRNRPNNCWCSPYNLTAFQRAYQTLNDTVNFIKDDALVKLYVTPSISEPDQIGVLQNRDSIKETADERIANNRSWEGVFTPIELRAITHCTSKYRSKLTMDDFIYTLRKTTMYNNRRTYIIDSRMADSSKEGAYSTLLIDCATYALAGASYLLNKPLIVRMNKKNNMSDYFQYTQMAYALDSSTQKWFLKSLHTEARGILKSKKNKYTANIIDFVTLSIDTANVSPISKRDRAKKSDRLLEVFKPASAEAWKTIDSIIQSKEYSKYFTDVVHPSKLVPVLAK